MSDFIRCDKLFNFKIELNGSKVYVILPIFLVYILFYKFFLLKDRVLWNNKILPKTSMPQKIPPCKNLPV